MKKVSEKFSFSGWNIFEFLKGRKKLLVTIIGIGCAKFTLDADLTGLLAGGAAFEGIWSVLEYYLKKVELN